MLKYIVIVIVVNDVIVIITTSSLSFFRSFGRVGRLSSLGC